MTVPCIERDDLSGSESRSTLTYFMNRPGRPLGSKPTRIMAVSPGAIGSRENSGRVHPQLARAFTIAIGSFPALTRRKLQYTVPRFSSKAPKSCFCSSQMPCPAAAMDVSTSNMPADIVFSDMSRFLWDYHSAESQVHARLGSIGFDLDGTIELS